ncbi:MAG: RHS repeat-associated core domain-containing protein [bacterium]
MKRKYNLFGLKFAVLITFWIALLGGSPKTFSKSAKEKPCPCETGHPYSSKQNLDEHLQGEACNDFLKAQKDWNAKKWEKALERYYYIIDNHTQSNKDHPLNYLPARSHMNIGLYLKYIKHWDEAIDEFQKGIDFIPDSRAAQDAKTSIACIHTFRGNYEKAKNILKSILAETKDWDQVKYCSYWIRKINKQQVWERDFPRVSCGPKALSTLLKLKGINTSPKEIKDLCSNENNIVSLLDLKNAALSKGIKTEGMKEINLDQLKEIALPAIAFVNPGHYIVISEVNKDEYIISDPYIRGGKPFNIYNKKLLDNIWTGYLLIITEQASPSNSYIQLTKKEMEDIKGGVCFCCPESDLGGGEENPNTEFDDGGDPCALGGGQSPGMPSIKVNTVNLNLIIQDVDLSFGSLGPKAIIKRTYNADDHRESAFGRSWTFNYNQYLIESPGDNVNVIMAEGATHEYIPYGDGSYAPPLGVYNNLTKYDDGTFSLSIKKDKTIQWYNSNGILQKISDHNGNSVLFEYDPNNSNRLDAIIDAAGRTTFLTYNENNKIIAVTDPSGRQATYSYDEQGNLISTTDMAGNSVTYTYDPDSYITSIITAKGTTSITHTSSGEGNALESIIYPSWNTYTYGTGDSHYKIEVTDPEGGVTTYLNDYDGFTEGITDPLGNITQYIYNDQGDLVTIIDPDNHATQLEYDPDSYGNITKITDPLGNSYLYTYDSRDNLTSRTDPLGRTYTYTYDPNDNLISILDPQNNQVDLIYNAQGLLTTMTDPLGHSTTFVYDDQGNVISVQNPLNYTTTYAYDNLGRIITVTDANGHTISYTYDGLDRVEKIIYPDGTYEDLNYFCCGLESVIDRNGNSTCFMRDNDNRLIGILDALNHHTIYQYDKAGNRIAVIDAENQGTFYEYDLAGRLIIERKSKEASLLFFDDLENGQTNWTADSPWELTESVAKSGTYCFTDSPGGDYQNNVNTSLYLKPQDFSQYCDYTLIYWTRYDIEFGFDKGYVEVSTDGGISWDRVDSVTGWQDEWNERKIDLNFYGGFPEVNIRFRLSTNNMSTHDGWYIDDVRIDAKCSSLLLFDDLENGETNWTAYSPWALTESVAKSGTHSFTDSPGGDYQNDANTSLYLKPQDFSQYPVYTLTYWTRYAIRDYFDKGYVEISTDGGISWDRVDSVIGWQDEWIERKIDLNLYAGFPEVNIRFKLCTNNTGTDDGWYIDDVRVDYSCPDIAYYYDDRGNLIRKKDKQANNLYYSYDDINRLTGITYPHDPNVSFSYNEVGNLINMSDSTGISTFEYNEGDRLISFTDDFSQQVSYGYDAIGNCTSLTYPDSKTVSYVYNPVRKLERVCDWLNNEITWIWDPVGNLKQIIYPNGVITTMDYDSSNRLITLNHTNGSAIASYQYTLDGVGNRVAIDMDQCLFPIPPMKEHTYNYSSMNQLTSVDETTTYSYDDHGNITSKISAGLTTTYTYDGEDRLIQVQASEDITQYSYNGLGHRISKQEDSQTTRYVLDINGPLSRVIAETNEVGQITSYYVYASQIGLVSKITPDRQAYYYHFDGLGNTICITDGSGNIVNKYAYDEFGNLTDYVETIPNPFRYVGKYGIMDEKNGLLFMRARYYDPEIGRFLTQDPIGFAGGDLNLYVYVRNNPVNFIDPYGLWSLTVQVGTSLTGGMGKGGTIGGGVAFGYNSENGFEYGSYEVIGAGGFGGAEVSRTLDFTFSTNTSISQLEGWAHTIGGSVSPTLTPISLGPTFGLEANIPIGDAKPSFTFSPGFSYGAPAEVHGFKTYTWIQSKSRCQN